MLESLQDRTEASYLVTELAKGILVEESEVVTKLGYIQRTVAHAKDSVAVEDAKQLRLLMLSPETAKYFTGSTFSALDGSYQSVAAKNTETQLNAVMSYVAASGLVFAHSFLESVLETLLRITRLCDIAPWLLLIRNKDVSISAIVETGLEPAIETKLNKFIVSLHKEGLLDKIDYLAKVLKCSISKSNIIDYTYDSERLNRIDTLRHQFSHHRKKDYRIETAQADITYVYRTALHFLDLVVHHYDLYGAQRPK
ncbi:MAG TPA: hypothetical protein VGM65_13945 [Candidatus Udaeobacter sp.]|jgi:hypothetical protein